MIGSFFFLGGGGEWGLVGICLFGGCIVKVVPDGFEWRRVMWGHSVGGFLLWWCVVCDVARGFEYAWACGFVFCSYCMEVLGVL